ncbi:hypothetical protein ACOMHN_005899 [Nucella lapillus]
MDTTHPPAADSSSTTLSNRHRDVEEGKDISNAVTNSGENEQGDSELEVMEADEEEVEEITVIELSDTEIREEDEDEEDSAEEELVIKEEPVDDYGDGCVNFDPSQLGYIVTETELPEEIIGGLVNGMYKCKFCPTKFAARNRMIAHVERHISNGTIRKCRFCDFYTTVTQTLLEHECKHTKEKLYQCTVCDHRCRLKNDMARHLETHTASKRYKCQECGHRTRTAGNLKKHMERHWPDMPRDFVCRLCGAAFKRMSALKSHNKRRHNDHKPFFCDQCSFRTKTTWELTNHKAKHSNEHPFPCSWPNCGKSFKTKSDCSKHFKRHTGIKNHQCSLCGKKFLSATLLKRHIPTHSDVRNFECAECLKRFKTLRALKIHLHTHQMVKPFPCDVCFKTYASQFNLDMHKRVHEGGRPYQCPICVHGSREMDHLMAHMGSEHLHNFTYACGLCRKPFGKSFHLILHFQRCHKQEQRGRDDTVVYEPDYLDHNFQPESSGAFDPATFARYLASENLRTLWTAEPHVTVKQEPGVSHGSDDSGVSGVASSPPEERSGVSGESSGVSGDSSGVTGDSSGFQESSRLPEDCSGQPEDCSGRPAEAESSRLKESSGLQESSGLSKTSSGLPTESSGLPTESSGLPTESSGLRSGLPEESSGLPTESSGLCSGLPEESSGLSKESSGLPEESSGLRSGLPEESSGLSKESSRLPGEHSRLPEEKSGLPNGLQLPPVVQLGMYRGIPFCLARKNSGIILNYQKKGKKPSRWFMDMSQMSESDAERHKEYLRKKELGLLPQGHQQRKKSKMGGVVKRGRKPGPKPAGRGRKRWQSWTDEEEDSDEEEAYLLAHQVLLKVKKEGSGNQSSSQSQRSTTARARKTVVHFKNLPANYFDCKPRPAAARKKPHVSNSSKALYSHPQPSTSSYLGGKVAIRKQNKHIGKKKPRQSNKRTKMASVSNQRKRKAKGGKTVKGRASGAEKCWALTLAGPLPVSHYRPEEAALNTQCWLHALRSSAARGHFGVVPTPQNNMDRAPGDSREEFFARCLQLQVRTPRDQVGDNLQPVTNTSVSQEKCLESGSTEYEPERSDERDIDCMDDVTGSVENSSAEASDLTKGRHVNVTSRVSTEMSSAQASDLTAGLHEPEIWQAASVCVRSIVEAVSTEQESSHLVPQRGSSDSGVNTSSSAVSVGRDASVGMIGDVETGSTQMAQQSSSDTACSRESCESFADVTSHTESVRVELVASLVGDDNDVCQQVESEQGSREDSLLAPVKPESVEGSVSQPESVQGSVTATQPESVEGSVSHTQPESVEGSVTATQPESVQGSVTATQPESVEGSVTHTQPESVEGSVTHTQPESVEGSVTHTQPESVEGSVTQPESVEGSVTPTQPEFVQGSREDNSESAQQPAGSVDTVSGEDTGYLPKLQSEEEAAPGENSGNVLASELQSQSAHQNERRGELKVAENSVQKPESEAGLKNSGKDECSAAPLEETVQQNNFHQDTSQSEDIFNSGENCSAGSEFENHHFNTETCSEMTVHSDVNAQPHLSHTGDSQMENVSDTPDTTPGVNAENSDDKENGDIAAREPQGITPVSHFAEQDLTALPDSQSISVTCSVQKCWQEESEPMAVGSAERTGSIMVNDSAFEQAVIEETVQPVQLTKCLHVLVPDVQCSPCSSDYLHRLGVSKVFWCVPSLIAKRKPLKSKHKIVMTKHKTQKAKIKTVLKQCNGKTSKSTPKKETKQAVLKAKKLPQKKRKAGVLLQKSSDQKMSLAKSPRGQRKSVKQGRNVKTALTDTVADPSTSGISGLLLATATKARPKKLSTKTPSKSVYSKHSRLTGKAASEASSPQKGKSASRKKRHKELSSKASSSQKGKPQQRGRGQKPKQRTGSTAGGVWCVKEQEEDGTQHEHVEVMSGRNTVTVKLEIEEPDGAFTNVSPLGQGLDVNTANEGNTAVDGCAFAFSSDYLQVLFPDCSVSKKRLTAAQKGTKRKRNNSCVQATPNTKTVRKAQRSGQKTMRVKTPKQRVDPSKVSGSDSGITEDTLVSPVNPGETADMPFSDQALESEAVHSVQSDSATGDAAKKRSKLKQVRLPAKTKNKPGRKPNKTTLSKNIHKTGSTNQQNETEEVKASGRRKINPAASRGRKKQSENSALKTTRPHNKRGRKPKVKDTMGPGRKSTKRKPNDQVENDAARKRRKYMYVETDTGEFPDPPAKKRGRPPGPKVILDRSQANLCFDQSPLAADPDQTGVCLTAEGEVSSMSDPDQSAVPQSVTYDESRAQLVVSGLPPQLVQPVCAQNVPQLPVAGEACLVQISHSQGNEGPPTLLIDSGVGDIKPTLSELSVYIHSDVKPRLDKLSLGSAEQTEARQASGGVASYGEEEEARAALLQVLTSHLDMWEGGPSHGPQSGQPSVSTHHHPVRPLDTSVSTPHPSVSPLDTSASTPHPSVRLLHTLLPASCRGRKRKVKDRTFQIHPTANLPKGGEIRRSDRKKKLRLTEEQVRKAAGPDSADSDFDWEEGEILYGPNEPPQKASEDFSSDIEFVGADYSHVDLVPQRLSLLADISEEGVSTVDAGDISDIAQDQSSKVATTVNLASVHADETARGKPADSGLNTHTHVPHQDLLKPGHFVQDGSAPLYLENQADSGSLSQQGAPEKRIPQAQAREGASSRSVVEPTPVVENSHSCSEGVADQVYRDKTSDPSQSRRTAVPVLGGDAAVKGVPIPESPSSESPAQLSVASPPTPDAAKSFTVKVSGGTCVVVSMDEQSQASSVLHPGEEEGTMGRVGPPGGTFLFIDKVRKMAPWEGWGPRGEPFYSLPR